MMRRTIRWAVMSANSGTPVFLDRCVRSCLIDHYDVRFDQTEGGELYATRGQVTVRWPVPDAQGQFEFFEIKAAVKALKIVWSHFKSIYEQHYSANAGHRDCR
jgi:hypothetical protein